MNSDLEPKDAICITGLRVRACHGVLAHEQHIEQTFVIDVVLTVDLFTPSLSDELEHTINYQLVAETVVRIVQGDSVNLIEHLAGMIADEIMGEFGTVATACVTVHKPQAPIPYLVEDVSVTVCRTRNQYNAVATR